MSINCRFSVVCWTWNLSGFRENGFRDKTSRGIVWSEGSLYGMLGVCDHERGVSRKHCWLWGNVLKRISMITKSGCSVELSKVRESFIPAVLIECIAIKKGWRIVEMFLYMLDSPKLLMALSNGVFCTSKWTRNSFWPHTLYVVKNSL